MYYINIIIKKIFIFFVFIFFLFINNTILSEVTIASNKIQKFNSEIIKTKLIKLKQIFDKELITEDEYYKKRREILIFEEFEKLNILKNLLDQKLITQKEYNQKRKEILGFDKIITTTDNKDNSTELTDTTGPTIIVENFFQSNENMTAVIRGSVTDENEIVSFSIDGNSFDLNNGSFSLPFFVQPEGQKIEIVAIDIRGNKSSTFVKLIRTAKIKTIITFDSLDPRKLKVKIKSNAVALIIGIEKYENTFPALYAKKDALLFNDFAINSLGVPENNIKLLLNEKAKRSDTLKELSKWLPKVIDENITNLYIFFSGHGLASEDGKDLFLLPSDGDPELLEYTALMRNDIFDHIAKLNPKSVTVFLDTCYSGATRSQEFLVASKQIFIVPEEQNIPENFTVFSASSGKETAKILKEAKHGLFSYYLMKGLEGEADSNKDQQITNGELHLFINKQVNRQASQTPQLSGNQNQVLMQW